MGHYCWVRDFDLKISEDISDALDDTEFYLRWTWIDGQVDLDDGHTFKWSEMFERDLLFLQEMGVRGDIDVGDDFDSFNLYKLTDEGVKRFVGSVIYPDVPDEILGDTVKL